MIRNMLRSQIFSRVSLIVFVCLNAYLVYAGKIDLSRYSAIAFGCVLGLAVALRFRNRDGSESQAYARSRKNLLEAHKISREFRIGLLKYASREKVFGQFANHDYTFVENLESPVALAVILLVAVVLHLDPRYAMANLATVNDAWRLFFLNLLMCLLCGAFFLGLVLVIMKKFKSTYQEYIQ